MMERFSCEIVPHVTDEWRNGEVFFLLPTSGAGRVVSF